MGLRLNQPVINDLVNKTCVMKPPKLPKGQGSELLGCCQHVEILRVAVSERA